MSLRDAGDRLQSLGVSIAGISPDAVKAQKQFGEKNHLDFPLLSDSDHAVAEKYGTWKEKSMYGRTFMGILRSVFIIDADGVIEALWYGISPKETVPKVLSVLARE